MSQFYTIQMIQFNITTTLTLTIFLLMIPPPPTSTLFPYTTLFRSTPFSMVPCETVSNLPPLSTIACCALALPGRTTQIRRSEEHTSELQSHSDLVCRLLLEKKKIKVDTQLIR